MKTATAMMQRYSNPRDSYESNILEAATWLVENNMGRFKYSTQWITGNRQWYSPKEEHVITIKCLANGGGIK